METERSGEKQAVSEEDAAKAETMKNKATEFFKCELYVSQIPRARG